MSLLRRLLAVPPSSAAFRATTRRLTTQRPTLTCPSCSKPLPSNLPACTSCWSIRPLPPNISHYALFGLPDDPNPFKVDVSTLKKRFREAQSSCHPDAWASQSSVSTLWAQQVWNGTRRKLTRDFEKQDGDLAHTLSSRLNEAYQILLHPLSRAEYILGLHGLHMSEGEKIEDMEFMMEIMEARETIDDATQGDVHDVESLMESNDRKIAETVEELSALIAEKKWKEAKGAAIRLRYLEGIRRAGKKWTDNTLAGASLRMRLALLLRNRPRLLMQLDPSKRNLVSSASASASSRFDESTPGVKRSFSQQSSPALAPRPKVSRAVNLSGFPSDSTSPSTSTSQPHTMHGRKSMHASSSASNTTYRSSGPSRGPRRHKSTKKDDSRDHLPGPYHSLEYIEQEHKKSPKALKQTAIDQPHSYLNNFSQTAFGKIPDYVTVQGFITEGGKKTQVHRTTVNIETDPVISGIGDSREKKESVTLACISAIHQLQERDVLDAKKLQPPKTKTASVKEVAISDGTFVGYEQARSFMDYYCRLYNFSPPDIDYASNGIRWESVMTVNGRRIGLGSGPTKKAALTSCYLDATKYLESCDQDLWATYIEAAKTGKDLGLAPRVLFQASPRVEDAIGDLVDDIRRTTLYKKRPSRDALHPDHPLAETADSFRRQRWRPATALAAKSKRLQEQREAYLADSALEKIRSTRAALPVNTRAEEVLAHIAANEVTICMAATGSGKTTQIPQMILDDAIERGEGAQCNIICTQPRRLAAISVADRVAKERGETLGKSIGYHVRFESRQPEPDGSVTFCTTGVFLKQLQSALSDASGNSLDRVTHIIVDEVHERDIDTDLLLVVLKRLLADRRAQGKPLRVILMSATIDPTLFQQYFKTDEDKPADVITVPGRSFPVTKNFMDDFVPQIVANRSNRWIMDNEATQKYLYKELGQQTAMKMGVPAPRSEARESDEGLELPYPFIAATIAHVLQSSNDGHVLVFLPGWDEISKTQKMLLSPNGPLGIDFASSNYSLHLLHSSIPLAEQQAIFEPPAPGVRRVILATNIAETSVTIPDVVYVVDTAKVKEDRYDPDRHMSSLVSAWVGSSNLNQRAGRAGRHRSGEYYGILSQEHADRLQPYQTVEMKRVDLSNVVMHVKALNLGQSVEDVLAAAIEPPDSGRVRAAMQSLKMVGALDSQKNLTALGRVLLQLPVDVQLGRLVLYGSFFKSLDNALTLAAILSNREPFMAPMHVKQIAQAKKDSWSPENLRSDAIAALRAFNSWWEMQSAGEYVRANRFCSDNFLSKPTLLLIQKTKVHLLQALYRAGVIDISAGGQATSGAYDSVRTLTVPPALNVNRDSLSLTAALVAIACQPKFGIRTGERAFRTNNDKNAIIHPSSVNNRKREIFGDDSKPFEDKQLYAYADKRRNETMGGGATTYLLNTTRIDPLTYILFGAYNVEVVAKGLECDDWLPIVGDIRTLDDVQRLKLSIEGCMLRVFEGITMSRQRRGQNMPVVPREENESESGDEGEGEDTTDYRLSSEEIRDLDYLTRDVVDILDQYHDERIALQSRSQSRAATPMGSPYFPGFTRLPGSSGIGSASASGYSTPAMYQSRPGTPSRLQARRF